MTSTDTRINKESKVVVGLSGGVDSSVALATLKKVAGDVVGVSLRMKSDQSFNLAKKVCEKLNVEFHVVDVQKNFSKCVTGYFKKSLENNQTPSPCVRCNRDVKFAALTDFADRIGAEFIATGHYARVEMDSNRYVLKKGLDAVKDQSYFLSFLPKQFLKRTVFPLGEKTKKEVREMAKREGLDFFETVSESNDACFFDSMSQDGYLRKNFESKTGEIVDESGKVLGKHEGLHFYTIGQRKGIGLSGGPYFVFSKNSDLNKLVVTTDEKKIFEDSLIVENYNLLSIDEIKDGMRVEVKIRSTQRAFRAALYQKDDGIEVRFERPQRAVTSGQIAAFYRDDVLLGGGEIV